MAEGPNSDRSRVLLRPVATPLVLGFLALAGASLVLSALQLGWIPQRESTFVAFVLIAFAFPLQFLSSVFGFLARDSAVAAGMGVLSASWLTVGLIKLDSAPTATSVVLGILLLFAGTALLVPVTGAAFGKLVPALVLLVAAIRFFLTGLYQLTTSPGIQYAAGAVGLVVLIFAFYAALALELEDVRRKTVLPVLRVGEGKRAMEGGVEDQTAYVEREAGVREQL